MNYQKIYDALITKAKSRPTEPEQYYESHHVRPRCLGGGDNEENLVLLTAEEHYVAHQLLVKLNPGHGGLAYAAYLMTIFCARKQGRVTNKLFGWVRKAKVSSHKEFMNTPEMKAKFSELHKGKTVSEETRKKLSEANIGKTHSEETKLKMSKTRTGRKRGPMSEEQKLKLSIAHMGKKNPHSGKPLSEETKRKISEGNKGKKLTSEAITKRTETRRLNRGAKKSLSY
jgi:hypothetical protein